MRKLMLVLGVAAIVGCGGISKETYGAKEAEAAKYKQEAAALQSKAKSLEEQNATLQAKAGDLEKQLAETSAAKSELEVATSKLTEQAEQAESNRTIKLSERLLFKENSSKLTTESKRALDAMAAAIEQLKGKSIIVAGFTDDAESGGKNAAVRRWQLSSARALEVAKYLVGRGLDPALIAVAGFGEGRPVAPNDSMPNRAMNRRAELALTPSSLQLGTVDVSPATVSPQK
jgi:chemotaxis protein MotB